MVGKDQYGYMTLAFSGVPIVGKDQYAYISFAFSGSAWWEHQYGCISRAFSGSPQWGKINMATSPLPSPGPHGGETSI